MHEVGFGATLLNLAKSIDKILLRQLRGAGTSGRATLG